MKKRYWAILLVALLVGHLAYFTYYHGVWISWSVTRQYVDENRATTVEGEYAGTDDHFLIVVVGSSREHDPREILYEYRDGIIQPAFGFTAAAIGDFSHVRYFPQTRQFVYLRTDWSNKTTEIGFLRLHTSSPAWAALSGYPSQPVAAYDPESEVLLALNQDGKYYAVGSASGADYTEGPSHSLGSEHLPDSAALDYGGSHKPDVKVDGLSLSLKDVKIRNLFWDMVQMNMTKYAYTVLWEYLVFLFQLAIAVAVVQLLRRKKVI